MMNFLRPSRLLFLTIKRFENSCDSFNTSVNLCRYFSAMDSTGSSLKSRPKVYVTRPDYPKQGIDLLNAE